MTIKLAILPRTREGLSREGLQAYLADSHGPLVMAHGEVSAMFAGYVHHYVQDETSPLGVSLADRDALTIIHFARIEDMAASKASPAYAKIVGPDEDNFRELAGSLAMLLSETTVLAGPEDVARKLFIFRHGADPQDAEGWAAKLAPILAAQGEDGPIAAWRINTIVRTLEGPAPAELFDEVSLRGPIPADLADALTAAAQACFADAPASVLVTSPKIFVSSQRIETMEMSDSGLPPMQRVVTGHDENGRAIFKSEDVTPTKMIPSGDASFLTIWSTETVPADLNDERDGRDLPTGLTLERGSVIRITDMLPGKESPFHRTNSVDYGIVLKGEIELELDDGRKKTIREGGIIVQRGTNHLWRNTTDQVCRIAFILIEAPAYQHDGVALDEAKPEQVDPAYGEMGE